MSEPISLQDNLATQKKMGNSEPFKTSSATAALEICTRDCREYIGPIFGPFFTGDESHSDGHDLADSRIVQNTAPRTFIITGMEMPAQEEPERHNQDAGLTLTVEELESFEEAGQELAREASAAKRAAEAKISKANDIDLFSGQEKTG